MKIINRLCKVNAINLLVLLATIFISGLSQADDVPSWLSGKPDLNMIEERSALYEWVFHQADEQTNGLASQEDFAKKRLINLSNKLAAYVVKTNQAEFSAELRYLVIGAEEPMHFRIFITNKTVRQLLQK